MKISNNVRQLYSEKSDQIVLLKKQVDPIIQDICRKNNWDYQTRIKAEISFALKLETGRNAEEDFLGYRIVINKTAEIELVKKSLTEKYFQIIECRPKDSKVAKNDPYDFRFNEVRLYIKLLPVEGTEPKPFIDNIFEVQINTLFSYVWTKATHDLIYKSDNVSWGKSRIAYQIKALLEQAQYAIDTIDNTDASYFPKHSRFEQQQKVIELLNEKWSSDNLPSDLNRLSQNIQNLIKKLDSNIDELKEVIEEAVEKNSGSPLLNISPYQFIIKAYLNTKPQKFENLKDDNFKIVLTEGLELKQELINKLKGKNMIIDYSTKDSAPNNE